MPCVYCTEEEKTFLLDANGSPTCISSFSQRHVERTKLPHHPPPIGSQVIGGERPPEVRISSSSGCYGNGRGVVSSSLQVDAVSASSHAGGAANVDQAFGLVWWIV
ncbi:uncharacterized protein LOC107835114 isoform X2 [Poecilia formosa]|uniref:uncharacterized protein LOC107835114 isoform X2 n=1 Tax=Poecilia formosa TaxID=48698 RepID=UPI0007B8112B|nr:PREDICTED: uncharacterized protein LOC107835114 isoform X2 [Poecilia formosa]